MTPNRKNVLVGFVVLTAMLGLAWMILKIASSSATLFAHGTRFQLECDRADGVADGSPILYLGVNVGRVLSVKRMPDNQKVLIDAALNVGEQIPANVEGNIRPQSALSASAQINLEPRGSPSAQVLAPGGKVAAHFGGGGLVPPEFGALAAQIRDHQVVDHLNASLVTLRLELEKAGQLMDSARQVVADPKLRADLSGTLASVHQTADNFQTFSAKLERVADDTDATVRQVRTTVADGGQQLGLVSHQLNERMQQLAQVLDRMQSIANKIDKGEGTAGRLVNDNRLYESLVDSSRDLDITFKDMQRLVQQWEQDGFTLKLK